MHSQLSLISGLLAARLSSVRPSGSPAQWFLPLWGETRGDDCHLLHGGRSSDASLLRTPGKQAEFKGKDLTVMGTL